MTVNTKRANWDKENMRTVSCRLRKEEAEGFKKYAEYLGTTPHALLSEYVKRCLELDANIAPEEKKASVEAQNENAVLRDKLKFALRELDAARNRALRAEQIVDEFLRRNDGK